MVIKLIKQGYKQTELGLIPDDWDVDKIQNHANITTGAKNTQDRIVDGKFPFFVRSQKIEKINTYSYDGEAILTAGDGVGTGKVFHYINGKFDFHQRVYSISDFDNRLDGYFFYLYFSSHFLARIMSMTAKSSVDSVRRDMIAEMLIPLPQKKEQIDISAIIKDIVELIETINKTIEKKKNIKQGAIQELLSGKRRLSERKTDYKQTEIGMIPKDWEIKKVGNFVDIKNGYAFKGEFFTDKPNENIVLTPVNFNIGGGFKTEKFKYTMEMCAEEYVLKEGSIIVTMTDLSKDGDTLGYPAKIPCKTRKKFLHNQRLGLLMFKSKVSKNFIYWVMRTKRYHIFVVGSATGSTVKHTSPDRIKQYLFALPLDYFEQEQIATVLSNMDSEIEELEKNKEKYIMIKNGMMQKLLTGEIRVK